MKRTYYNSTGFLDLLFNSLLLFVILFAIAFIQIKPETIEKNIHSKAEFIITVTWENKDTNDIDTWLMDPAGNVLFFRKKEVAMMHLDRDDLGGSNDTFEMPDGTKVSYDYNQEITTIRGCVPGEWILNIHFWRNNTGRPSKVTVKVERLNPTVTTVLKKTVTMNKQGEQVTIARFTMTRDCTIMDINELPSDFVGDYVQEAGAEAHLDGEMR